MNHFTPAIDRLRQAKRNGFAGIFLIVLINDLLAAAAVLFVYGLGG